MTNPVIVGVAPGAVLSPFEVLKQVVRDNPAARHIAFVLAVIAAVAIIELWQIGVAQAVLGFMFVFAAAFLSLCFYFVSTADSRVLRILGETLASVTVLLFVFVLCAVISATMFGVPERLRAILDPLIFPPTVLGVPSHGGVALSGFKNGKGWEIRPTTGHWYEFKDVSDHFQLPAHAFRLVGYEVDKNKRYFVLHDDVRPLLIRIAAEGGPVEQATEAGWTPIAEIGNVTPR